MRKALPHKNIGRCGAAGGAVQVADKPRAAEGAQRAHAVDQRHGAPGDVARQHFRNNGEEGAVWRIHCRPGHHQQGVGDPEVVGADRPEPMKASPPISSSGQTNSLRFCSLSEAQETTIMAMVAARYGTEESQPTSTIPIFSPPLRIIDAATVQSRIRRYSGQNTARRAGSRCGSGRLRHSYAPL